jgi:hypothetical protein
MTSPSVLTMLLTTKYVDGLPLHRLEQSSLDAVSKSRVKP